MPRSSRAVQFPAPSAHRGPRLRFTTAAAALTAVQRALTESLSPSSPDNPTFPSCNSSSSSELGGANAYDTVDDATRAKRTSAVVPVLASPVVAGARSGRDGGRTNTTRECDILSDTGNGASSQLGSNSDVSISGEVRRGHGAAATSARPLSPQSVERVNDGSRYGALSPSSSTPHDGRVHVQPARARRSSSAEETSPLCPILPDSSGQLDDPRESALNAGGAGGAGCRPAPAPPQTPPRAPRRARKPSSLPNSADSAVYAIGEDTRGFMTPAWPPAPQSTATSPTVSSSSFTSASTALTSRALRYPSLPRGSSPVDESLAGEAAPPAGRQRHGKDEPPSVARVRRPRGGRQLSDPVPSPPPPRPPPEPTAPPHMRATGVVERTAGLHTATTARRPMEPRTTVAPVTTTPSPPTGAKRLGGSRRTASLARSRNGTRAVAPPQQRRTQSASSPRSALPSTAPPPAARAPLKARGPPFSANAHDSARVKGEGKSSALPPATVREYSSSSRGDAGPGDRKEWISLLRPAFTELCGTTSTAAAIGAPADRISLQQLCKVANSFELGIDLTAAGRSAGASADDSFLNDQWITFREFVELFRSALDERCGPTQFYRRSNSVSSLLASVRSASLEEPLYPHAAIAPGTPYGRPTVTSVPPSPSRGGNDDSAATPSDKGLSYTNASGNRSTGGSSGSTTTAPTPAQLSFAAAHMTQFPSVAPDSKLTALFRLVRRQTVAVPAGSPRGPPSSAVLGDAVTGGSGGTGIHSHSSSLLPVSANMSAAGSSLPPPPHPSSNSHAGSSFTARSQTERCDTDSDAAVARCASSGTRARPPARAASTDPGGHGSRHSRESDSADAEAYAASSSAAAPPAGPARVTRNRHLLALFCLSPYYRSPSADLRDGGRGRRQRQGEAARYAQLRCPIHNTSVHNRLARAPSRPATPARTPRAPTQASSLSDDNIAAAKLSRPQSASTPGERRHQPRSHSASLSAAAHEDRVELTGAASRHASAGCRPSSRPAAPHSPRQQRQPHAPVLTAPFSLLPERPPSVQGTRQRLGGANTAAATTLSVAGNISSADEGGRRPYRSGGPRQSEGCGGTTTLRRSCTHSERGTCNSLGASDPTDTCAGASASPPTSTTTKTPGSAHAADRTAWPQGAAARHSSDTARVSAPALAAADEAKEPTRGSVNAPSSPTHTRMLEQQLRELYAHKQQLSLLQHRLAEEDGRAVASNPDAVPAGSTESPTVECAALQLEHSSSKNASLLPVARGALRVVNRLIESRLGAWVHRGDDENDDATAHTAVTRQARPSSQAHHTSSAEEAAMVPLPALESVGMPDGVNGSASGCSPRSPSLASMSGGSVSRRTEAYLANSAHTSHTGSSLAQLLPVADAFSRGALSAPLPARHPPCSDATVAAHEEKKEEEVATLEAELPPQPQPSDALSSPIALTGQSTEEEREASVAGAASELLVQMLVSEDTDESQAAPGLGTTPSKHVAASAHSRRGAPATVENSFIMSLRQSSSSLSSSLTRQQPGRAGASTTTPTSSSGSGGSKNSRRVVFTDDPRTAAVMLATQANAMLTVGDDGSAGGAAQENDLDGPSPLARAFLDQITRTRLQPVSVECIPGGSLRSHSAVRQAGHAGSSLRSSSHRERRARHRSSGALAGSSSTSVSRYTAGSGVTGGSSSVHARARAGSPRYSSVGGSGVWGGAVVRGENAGASITTCGTSVSAGSSLGIYSAPNRSSPSASLVQNSPRADGSVLSPPLDCLLQSGTTLGARSEPGRSVSPQSLALLLASLSSSMHPNALLSSSLHQAQPSHSADGLGKYVSFLQRMEGSAAGRCPSPEANAGDHDHA